MEVVSESSVLVGIEAAHPQDDLSSRRSFALNHNQIYSPLDHLCLDKKFTPNKSTSRTI